MFSNQRSIPAKRYNRLAPAAATLLLGVVAPFAHAQDLKVSYLGTLESGRIDSAGRSDSRLSAADAQLDSGKLGGVHRELVSAVPTAASIVFNPGAVGGAAQVLNAVFAVSGYAGSFTPTVAFAYGIDYSAGAVSCTMTGASTENCSVPVKFAPNLPGGHKDALLLADGATTLSTVLLYGIGQAPLSLIQPGVQTADQFPYSDGYLYSSVTDDDGTVYVADSGGNSVYSFEGGVFAKLPIAGLQSPNGIAIDGSKTVYIAQNTYSDDILTYNLLTGAQGKIALRPPPPYVWCPNSNYGNLEYLYSVAVDGQGNLYALETLCQQIIELRADGSYVVTPLNPDFTQPGWIALDDNDDLFITGYAMNEITAAGAQKQLNTLGNNAGIGTDAAGTLYAARFNSATNAGISGIGELTANLDYASAVEQPWQSTGWDLGVSTGRDGTVNISDYDTLYQENRSQGLMAFGEQQLNTAGANQEVDIYNGGNEPLAIGKIAISGAGFALQTAASSPCSPGLVLAPGAACNIDANLTPTHPGNWTGTITVTTNSNNLSGTLQQIALSGFVYGPYVTASPNPATLPNQLIDTTTSPAFSIKLSNVGLLYAADISYQGSSNPAFSGTLSPSCASVNPAANCALSVTLTTGATAGQVYNGVITLSIGGQGLSANQILNIPVQCTSTSTLLPQTIAFTAPLSAVYGSSLVLGGTASSGLPVSYTVTHGSATVLGNKITFTGVGSVTVQATQPGSSTYAPAAPVNAGITVTPATLTVNPKNANKSYGAAVPALTYTLAGLVNGDTASVLSATPTVTTTAALGSPVGTYPETVDLNGATAANYNVVAGPNGTFTETAAKLSVKANSAGVTYGSAIPAPTYTISGLVNGDTAAILTATPTVSTTATNPANVGSYPITVNLNGATAPNYTIATSNATLTVKAATLTVQPASPSSVYGAALPAFPSAITGFQYADTAASVYTGAPSLTSTATTGSGAGSYTIASAVGTLSFLAATPNYVFSYRTGKLTITKAPLTVTANSLSMTQGQPVPTLTDSTSGYVNGDTSAALTGAPTLTTTATSASPAGTYPISIKVGTLAASNYSFTFVNGVLTVHP